MKTRLIKTIGSVALLFLTSCVQKEHEKIVTFKVDMTQVQNVQSVGLRGQFTSPSWEVTIPMLDKNGNGIFEVTLNEVTAQNSVAFKFVKNNDEFELQNQSNRLILFKYQPEVIIYESKFNNRNGKQRIKL